MDIFIEKIVAKRKTGEDRLITTGLIIAGVVLSLFAFSLPFLSGFAPVVAVAVIYGVYYVAKSRNIEFEYAVTNGDLDIDKIIAQRKRKRVFSANCKEFEVVAKVKSIHYNDEIKRIAKQIQAVSSMDSEDVYFTVANYQGQKTVVFFEPDQRMLNAFKTYIPRKVHE
ncbi:MAG: DUF6106 family protein [Clostridia bacterium]|nr:DUF6106 family protein [Clostridia bacterium]